MFQYQLSPILRGVVFLIGPGVYALAAPLWGWITDKRVNNVSSYIFYCLSLSFKAFFYFITDWPTQNVKYYNYWLLLPYVIECQS